MSTDDLAAARDGFLAAWNTYQAARQAMIPNFAQVHAAERYRTAA